jgi:23S rRNA (adenine2503-C2)-methyltransferase
MSTPATDERVNLLGLDRPALETFVTEMGGKAFRARQLMNWIYKRGEGQFENMTDLAKDFRAQLVQRAEIRVPEIVTEQISSDGTRKWKLRADSAQAFEMVYIPETDRGTLCISSQVGCVLDCSFCSTAQQGFNRNLTASEIVGQVWLASRLLGDVAQARAGAQAAASGDAAGAATDAHAEAANGTASGTQLQRLTNGAWVRPSAHGERDRIITNVVLMGMGEPLANFRNVIPAVRIFMDDFGFDLSRRRVTLSTSGLVPQIYKLAEEVNVALAVSLHAPNDELRNELVPINRKHPIKELLEACWHYIDEQNGRSVTFEYVMLDGVNDSPAHARELARLLKGHPAKINLIPFNPFPGTRYRRSSAEAIQTFRDELIKRGLIATVRKTRGDDIDAACGQLAGRVVDRTTVRLGSKTFGVAVQP